MKPTRLRAREALRSHDFRRLFAIRLVSQSADGLFQVALIASIVFDPQEQSTAVGFAIATLVVSLPFSILGPFTGVFIDRWSRRKILVVAPLLRAALAWLVLFDPLDAPVAFYVGALWVLSVNRFFLATAIAVVPRLVPREDLLMANSMSVVGGTVALLAGVFVGGWIADLVGEAPVIALAMAQWVATSLIASRIRSPLVPHHLPEAPVRDELRRVVREFADGVRSPRAHASGAGADHVDLAQPDGTGHRARAFALRLPRPVRAGRRLLLEPDRRRRHGRAPRHPHRRRARGAVHEGADRRRARSPPRGLTLLAVATTISGWSVLLASFAIGLTFAWMKIPVDTMVQEAIPDGYRGRVFAVYDVAYNVARVIASFLAIPMLNHLGEAWSVAVVGLVFLAWTPVLPRWIGRIPELDLRFYAGGRADEEPRAVVWGGVEETVEVERRALEETDGVRRSRYRLRMQDGTVIDVSKVEPDGAWSLERELG